MRRFSSVVLLETLFEISGCSHIAFTSRGATFNKIDVMHWPFFAETSEGVLLRASEHLSPAKRQARSRTEGVRFELTIRIVPPTKPVHPRKWTHRNIAAHLYRLCVSVMPYAKHFIVNRAGRTGSVHSRYSIPIPTGVNGS